MELLSAIHCLLNCSIIIPMIPLCFYPVQGYVRSRMSVLIIKISLALIMAAVTVMFVGYFIVPIPRETNIVLFMIAAYAFYLYNREVDLSFSKKLFVFLTSCLVGGFSMLFATMVDYTLYPSGSYLEFSLEALGVQLMFLVLADIILYLPLSRNMGWVVANFQEESIWKRVWVFPALFLASLFCMRPKRYSTMYTGRVGELYPIILLFFAFFVGLIYFMFYMIAYTYVEKQKTETANQMLSIQGAQYQQLLRAVEESERLRHDFRHQLIVVAKLVEQEEYKKLKEYVSRYIDDAQVEMKLYSSSAAVNALISYYDSVCGRAGIRTEFSVSLPDKLPVSEQDFCVMLGNLLENAIDGVKEAGEPYICLKIRQTSSNMLAVKIMNPCRGELKKEGGHFYSSKREGFGQGLESVNMIAQKYQGVMEVLADGQSFMVKVLLQIPVY